MLKTKHTLLILSFFVLPLVIGCGKGGTAMGTSELGSSDSSDDNGGIDDSTPIVEMPGDEPTTPVISNKIQICSALSLSGVTWTSSLTEFTINALALGLNITGSYEGHTGWDNITNNFDGQGLSLGLFNQNFGQGTLQPLMIQFRDAKNTKFKSFFTAAQYTSLNGMLTTWGGVTNVTAKATPTNHYQSDYSDLDDPSLIEAEEGITFSQKVSSAKNQKSVNWAVANLYSGGSFKAAWKTALQNMAHSPEFISLQIQAANSIHKKAEGYMTSYKFTTLRAYLFLFDVVVQNGGLSDAIKTKYFAWLKSNANSSEDTRLKKLLDFRAALVSSAYVNDVKARKLAIINGKGTVHGSNRNFPKEYCVNNWAAGYSSNALGQL